MFHLNTRVDFDEVMPAELVDQEFASTSVPVSDALRYLEGICEHSLSDILGQVHSRGDFDDLLVPPLNRAVAFEQMNAISLRISENLNFNVPWPLEEAFDENGAVAEGGLGLTDSSAEGVCEFGLFANDAHAASTSAHSGLDNDYVAKRRELASVRPKIQVHIPGKPCCSTKPAASVYAATGPGVPGTTGTPTCMAKEAV